MDFHTGGVWLLAQPRSPQTFGYQAVNTFPHDPDAFTQGLVFHDGFLLESTGKYGQPTLRRVDIETGRVVQSHSLSRDLFGEGITVYCSTSTARFLPTSDTGTRSLAFRPRRAR